MTEQQILFEVDTMTNEIRRRAERLLSSYRSLPSIIKSMELDVKSQSLTTNYTPSEIQRVANPKSQTEEIILKMERLEEKKLVKQKLDILFDGFNETEKKIIDMRYLRGRFDDVIIDELNLSRRSYYKIKQRILVSVCEAFYWL